jgi:hypothetical protein
MTAETERLPEQSANGQLESHLDKAVKQMEAAPRFSKGTYQARVLDIARRLAAREGGLRSLYDRITVIEAAGIFDGSDWAHPEILQPVLASNSLWQGDKATATLEVLSELRFLAVANRDLVKPNITAEQARHFLSQVLALNLSVLFEGGSEAERTRTAEFGLSVRSVLQFLGDHIGFENILDRLIEEIWRILSQRPIQVNSVKAMIAQIAMCLNNPDIELGGAGRGADQLISAVYGPTPGCREDPGLEVYTERLLTMDLNALRAEASGFARAMHDTGLVSPYHPAFLRLVLDSTPELVPVALGLSSTGLDSYSCYQDLVHTLIREAIFPETSEAVYGLTLLLERGILHMPPIVPAIWRQIALPLSDQNRTLIESFHGPSHPARVILLAGILNILGQPFGVGQGDNPTCQSARAISMWSYSDPDYLMQMVAWAARDDEVVMHFEDKVLSSKELAAGMARTPPYDVDVVSMILVPHIDRIYMEMGRLCADRGDDPHRWVNPELHGWWVGRGCRIAVDVPTSKLSDYEGFVRDFIAVYHPSFNGNQPLIHPQPAGIAVTDSLARFIGWHAITITRVTLDQNGDMRVYFFNPNNDSGQDWGHDARVSTHGYGERYGEASLPIALFASRLYLFHYDPLEPRNADAVPEDLVETVSSLARDSWALER